MKDSGKGLTKAPTGDKEPKARLVISLQGEAAARLLMWAESNHLHKNVAGRIMLEKGMAELGLIPKKKL